MAGTPRAVPPPSPAGTATRVSRVHKHRRVDTGCGAPAAELVNLSVHFTVFSGAHPAKHAVRPLGAEPGRRGQPNLVTRTRRARQGTPTHLVAACVEPGDAVQTTQGRRVSGTMQLRALRAHCLRKGIAQRAARGARRRAEREPLACMRSTAAPAQNQQVRGAQCAPTLARARGVTNWPKRARRRRVRPRRVRGRHSRGRRPFFAKSEGVPLATLWPRGWPVLLPKRAADEGHRLCIHAVAGQLHAARVRAFYKQQRLLTPREARARRQPDCSNAVTVKPQWRVRLTAC